VQRFKTGDFEGFSNGDFAGHGGCYAYKYFIMMWIQGIVGYCQARRFFSQNP
jgi:hypothetical protein